MSKGFVYHFSLKAAARSFLRGRYVVGTAASDAGEFEPKQYFWFLQDAKNALDKMKDGETTLVVMDRFYPRVDPLTEPEKRQHVSFRTPFAHPYNWYR